jgi:hypothetical protein
MEGDELPFDAQKLREWIARDGRPAYKIAADCGYPQSLVSRLMRVGFKQDPRVGTLEKFAEILGCTVNDFLSDVVEYTTTRPERGDGPF